MDFILDVLEKLFFVVVEAGVIIGILYLLYRFHWKRWIHDGLIRAGEYDRAKKYE